MSEVILYVVECPKCHQPVATRSQAGLRWCHADYPRARSECRGFPEWREPPPPSHWVDVDPAWVTLDQKAIARGDFAAGVKPRTWVVVRGEGSHAFRVTVGRGRLLAKQFMPQQPRTR